MTFCYPELVSILCLRRYICKKEQDEKKIKNIQFFVALFILK